jgi:polyisoprenoid-binding protein YceI
MWAQVSKMSKILIAFALAIPALAAQHSLQLTPDNTKIEWTLSDPLHTVHGSFKLKRGYITFDTDSGKAAGEIVVDIKSGESGSTGRDSRMHAHVLESSKYPEAIFTPDRIDGKFAIQGASSLKLRGTLEIHGAAHEITMNVEVAASGSHMNTSINFAIPYVAWGMKDPSNFLLRVGKSVQVTIRTSATPQL